jgi:hypothetical protein
MNLFMWFATSGVCGLGLYMAATTLTQYIGLALIVFAIILKPDDPFAPWK